MSAIAEFLRIDADTAPAWIAGLALLLVVLFVILLTAWGNARRLRRRWDTLLRDAGDKNLPALLEEYLLAGRRHEDRLVRLEMRVEELEDRLRASTRKVGMVKYDAFDEVGGEQSFALAMLDDSKSGVVLTSIVGRAETRVFAKELHEGKAAVALTTEEQTAIGVAERRD